MIGRVIEVASAGRHLARHRGLMTVCRIIADGELRSNRNPLFLRKHWQIIADGESGSNRNLSRRS